MTASTSDCVEDRTYEDVSRIVSYLFDHQPKPGSRTETVFLAMCDFMESYEQEHYPLSKPSRPATSSELIEFELDRLGWPQSELARRTHIQPSHLSAVLNGRRALSLTQAKKLAALFDISLDELLDNPYRDQIPPAAGE